MKEAYGKIIPETLDELVDPKQTAVIVVDMQNDLVSPEGYLAVNDGQDVSLNRSIIPPIQNLIEKARAAGLPIVFVQYTVDPEHRLTNPAWVYTHIRERADGSYMTRVSLEGCFEGTWGWEVIPELKPEPEDIIIRKQHLGGFWGTNLNKVLRGNGIKSVLVTGTATGGCVLDTAVGAAANDYYTLIAKDCVAQNDEAGHELGLTFLMERYDHPTSEEVVTAWALAGG
jgi:nicotinamidase-related amidase